MANERSVMRRGRPALRGGAWGLALLLVLSGAAPRAIAAELPDSAPVSDQGSDGSDPPAATPAAPVRSGFTLFNPTPAADLRSFSTDRPPKANSPYTVDAGHVQYETDLAVFGEGDQSGVKTRDWTLLDPTLKLGLTNTVDAELQVVPYQQAMTETPGSKAKVSGWGDTYARLKINLVGDDGGDFAVALLPYVKLPTARRGLGNGSVEGGLIAPVSLTAPAGFTVVVMPEADALKDAAGGGYHAALDFLVNVSHPLTSRWTLYSELFTTQSLQSSSSQQSAERPIYTWDEALTYALTPNLQLDFGGNFALNSVAPRRQVYMGVSQRF